MTTSHTIDKPLSMAAAPIRIRKMESGTGPPTTVDVNVMTTKTSKYVNIPYDKIWSVMETVVNGNRTAMKGSTILRGALRSCYMIRLFRCVELSSGEEQTSPQEK